MEPGHAIARGTKLGVIRITLFIVVAVAALGALAAAAHAAANGSVGLGLVLWVVAMLITQSLKMTDMWPASTELRVDVEMPAIVADPGPAAAPVGELDRSRGSNDAGQRRPPDAALVNV